MNRAGDHRSASIPRVVLATHNSGKLTELRTILAGRIAGLSDAAVTSAGELGLGDVLEDGVSFAENALKKARAVCRETGLVAVADDSGLAVDVLGGAPGIFSARWCGRHGDDAANLDLLLAQLADVPDPHRGASFRCAAALVTPAGDEHVEMGLLAGSLTTSPRGSGGFGYDPILEPVGLGRTCAELSAVQKHAISHRGIAFRALAPFVERALAI